MWHSDSMHAQISQLETALVQPAYRNFTQHQILGTYQWPNAFVGQTWAEELGYLRGWLSDRAAWIDGQLINYPVVSNADLADNGGYIWPNPALTGQAVFFEGQADYVECIDMLGRVVQTQALVEMPVSLQLDQPGLYIVRYYSKGVLTRVFNLSVI
jgi:hypothetical protein